MSGKYGTAAFSVQSVPQTFYVRWKNPFFVCFKTGYDVEKKGKYLDAKMNIIDVE